MSIEDKSASGRPAGVQAEAAAGRRNGRPRVTKIEDVAALVGVSASTVSRALARPDRVLPETRARILEAVRATGYTPNVAARSLRAARSMNVLVVLSSPASDDEPAEAMVTPFFNELLLGVDRALSSKGYGVLLGNLYESVEREERIVNLVSAGQVDGVLLMVGRMPKTTRHSLADSGVPMVGVTTPDFENVPVVTIDEEAAVTMAAEHLLALGHRRFGYLGGPDWHPIEQVRCRGFLAALARSGIPADAVTRYPGDFRISSGIQAAATFLAQGERPSAVFAASDEMAIGFMKEVRRGGVSIPGDLSLMGFDGIPFAEFCEPPLTTIRQPREGIGRKAAELLLRLMQGRELAPEEHAVRFAPELQTGGTTAPPGN
ncbi:LacI family DNA-binding transcriptional regulator [Geminicoccus roseus]|uniref:LacI family DNA-binding transcriptional regulator n=1 Tax=Geminicoccus roseus TaxID=404900 RepID=UPI00040BF42A|nr:LacI family DNA-binding transcriptional regulator [Geminicoccus roseus]